MFPNIVCIICVAESSVSSSSPVSGPSSPNNGPVSMGMENENSASPPSLHAEVQERFVYLVYRYRKIKIRTTNQTNTLK